MHDRLNERVRVSIEEWRIDNELQKAIQELLREDTRYCWAMATLIVMRYWDLLNSMRHLFYERYDFDIHRWLIKDFRDRASLPQGRNTQETNWIVALSMYYAYWEFVSRGLLAAHDVAMERNIYPPSLICVFYLGLRSYFTKPRGWHPFYSKLLPTLSEKFLISEAGLVASKLSLNKNRRLRHALSGWGESPAENLLRELPGTILAAYDEADDSQDNRSVVNRVARLLEDLGSESASRPDKLTNLSSDAAPKDSGDEYVREIERKNMLDVLEGEANLSSQQAEIWRRLREGMSIKEIADDLGVSTNSVSVQKNQAKKKFQRAIEKLGLENLGL